MSDVGGTIGVVGHHEVVEEEAAAAAAAEEMLTLQHNAAFRCRLPVSLRVIPLMNDILSQYMTGDRLIGNIIFLGVGVRQ